MDIALSVIREHLETSDIDVTLVVFGRSSYQLASGLTEQVEAYIDENYVIDQAIKEYGSPIDEMSDIRRRRELWERERYSGSVFMNRTAPEALEESAEEPKKLSAAAEPG